MKRDLRERLINKQRQYWWDRGRYSAWVKWLFGTYAAMQAMIFSFFRSLHEGIGTFMIFALPAATALAFLLALAIGYLLTHLAVVVMISIVLFVWMVFINLLHLPSIAVHRCVESFRRRMLNRNYYVCPYCHVDIWETRHRIPAYECPDHHEKHYFLWPSSYGLLSHQSVCGCKLPVVGRKGALKASCPVCQDKRPIDIKGFGRLPHLGLAVLEARPAGGSEFLKSAWAGITAKGSNGAGLQVKYADQSSKPEFENLVQPSTSPTLGTQRQRERGRTWVWRVSDARGRVLLYLHESNMKDKEGESPPSFFKVISGLAFALSLSDCGDEDAAENVIGSAIKILETRFGSTDKLRIPTAVIVQDYTGKNPRSALEEVDHHHHLVRLIESSFGTVGYFGGGTDQSVAAFKWLLSQCWRKRAF